MWPGFIEAPHHRIMAEVIEGVMEGSKRRTIVNMAPRHTKSEFYSYLLPAFYLGKYPTRKIIQICATATMAQDWSRKVRNLVSTEDYQRVFPGTALRQDSKSAGRWHTNRAGEYFAVGTEGNVTGKGGDLVIIDDPTGEQQAVTSLSDPTVYKKVYDWYVAGPRQRLQPNGAICVVQSRWATNDFTGQLLEAEKRADGPNVDHWELIELPAVLPSGDIMFPNFWTAALLEETRMSLPPQRWMAQYQQQPSSDFSAILKREWWKRWKFSDPPPCDFKLVTMDTAYSDKETADYSAVTTWGVFNNPDQGKDRSCMILLDAWRGRLTFPDLKAAAHKHYLKWQPDMFLVEAKASGAPLIYELRARGIPVSEYNPVRGTKLAPNTKIMRANSVSDLMASGTVWAPDRTWADEVIEECASFPGGADHDDYVDCVIMALLKLRQGGLISLATDNWDSDPLPYRKRVAYY